MFESLFRNTLSAGQWALLAAVPPAILALYFLKLRRMPLEVPSTYLWMRAIEDMHVNSLWQRLRKSLLLFLQLLMVLLAMLALLRPGWQGTRLEGQRFIFVVDNSASMSATDAGAEGDGRSRLEVSKEKVAALIDQMERGMTAMIISFADSPRVVQQFTDNRRLLEERLATIEPTARSTDLAGALRLAGDLANPGRVAVAEGAPDAEIVEANDTTLYLFTDGRFAAVKDFDLGNLEPIYVPVGSEQADNLAITAFNTRQNEARPQEKEAFVQVVNYTEQPRRIEVELTLDGVFLDKRSADAPAGGTASFTFPLADASGGKLEARIDRSILSTAQDALMVDNNAFTPINDIDPGKILLVTPGNIVVETALSTARAGRLGEIETIKPQDLEGQERKRALVSGDYDLVIYDRCAPPPGEPMPRASTLFIGSVPPLAAWRGEADQGDQLPAPERVQQPQVIDWNRAHPLMSYVQVGDPLIADSLVLTPPPGAATLIDSTVGPLLAVAPRESYEDLVLGFPILDTADGATVANTDWYRSRGFPTFWLNVLDYFLGAAGNPSRNQTKPGAAVEIRPQANIQEIVVKGPDELSQTLKRNGEGPFVFQQTDDRGVYEVEAQGQVIERFAVNLFDSGESDIRLKPTAGAEGEDIEAIRIGYTDVVADSSQSPARKELWQWVLLLAIVVLVVEWYIYNRRVYL